MYLQGVKATANFTPVAEAYTGGDIISTAQEFVFRDGRGVIVPQGCVVRILTSVIKIDATAIISGETSYSLAMYSVTPPSAQANNAAWTLASADLPSYLGTLSLGTPVDLGAACYIRTQFTDKQDIMLASGKASIFGQLITAGSFTAAAVARQITLYGMI